MLGLGELNLGTGGRMNALSSASGRSHTKADVWLLIAKPVWISFHNVVLVLCCSCVVVVLFDSQRLLK